MISQTHFRLLVTIVISMRIDLMSNMNSLKNMLYPEQ
jgi:hypothetical protein